MKRKIVCFFAILFSCLALSSCALFGSENDGATVQNAKVLAKSENLVVIQVLECQESASVFDAMKFLKEKGELEFVSETSTYGESLLSLNGKENPADWSYYWQFYVSDESQGNPDSTYVFEDTTCYFAQKGISGIQAKQGGIYLWEFAKSTW